MQSPYASQNQIQTFFVSHEVPTGPIITNILKEAKTITDHTQNDDTEGMLSIGYGKRIIITAQPVQFKNIELEDIIEIVDYDAHKQILLIMGKKEPDPTVAIHWMIHHAKQEIGALLLIKNQHSDISTLKSINTIDAKPTGTILDRSKTILQALQTEQIINLQNEGILITARTIAEIHQQLNKK